MKELKSTNMPKVSIIVPIYNVEKYIDVCIKSIIHQTYKNLEIILVNDGSKDKSGTICEMFAKKDERIIVLHQPNGGASKARNNGLRHATGKYVCFVDSDDWLTRDSVEILVKKIEETGADFVSGNKCDITPIKNKLRCSENNLIRYSDKNSLSKLVLDLPGRGPVANIYKNDIIKKYKIYYPEDVLSREDTLFLFDYFSHCDIMASIKSKVYYVNRTRNNSLVRTYFKEYDKWVIMVQDKTADILSYTENRDNKYIVASLSIMAKMGLKQIAMNYIRNATFIEEWKIEKAFDYLEKFIIWDDSDYPYRSHILNMENRKIAETIHNYGVGDELFSLVSIPKQNKPLYQLIKVIKKVLAWIKIEYYRITV